MKEIGGEIVSQGNKIAVFIDDDNISMNMKTALPEKFSTELGYKRFKDWLSSFGETALVFVFAPDNSALVKGEFFYKQGFISVSCPILMDREEMERREKSDFERMIQGETVEVESKNPPVINTTDETMRKTAKIVIEHMSEITHICIASGDADFIPIVTAAKAKGKKVMIMISGLRSSSKNLLKKANRDERGKKMIHLFNPIRDS